MPSEKSHGTTVAPRSANGWLEVPVPAARSSTRSPRLRVDRLDDVLAPAPVLAQGQDVVGDVVAPRHGVEHAAYVVRVLAQVSAGHGRHPRRRQDTVRNPSNQMRRTCVFPCDTERSRIPEGLAMRALRLFLLTVLTAALLAGTAYGAGRAYRHLGDESASSSPTSGNEPDPADQPDHDAGDLGSPSSRRTAEAREAGRRARARRQGRAGPRAAAPAVPDGLAARADHRHATTRPRRRRSRASRTSGASRPPASSTRRRGRSSSR